MFTPVMRLTLTAVERADLDQVLRATSTPHGIARRARCVVMLADGASYAAICAALGVTDRFIARATRSEREGGML